MGSLDWAPIACTGILLLSGCAQILGIDDNVGAKSEVADAASIPDATTDAASTPDAGLPFCVDNTIPVGTSNVNTELGGTDDFAPSCTSGTGNDQAFLWKAPVTDYYVFDTVGSNFDTVLSLQTTCEANSEIACNNNRGAESISELVRKVEANDALVVIVDGFAGSQGVGKINIERVSCPDEDLEGQTGFPLVQTTINAGDDNTSVCGGAGFPDRAYHWVVPEDGLWAFNATAAGFATTIAVQDGPRCQDELLGCSTSSGPELHSEV
ncbi:MAG: hypothetical protein JKY56_22245, partial [Kofleriaceae bacterium]|nr:hypothetical protein [Kofleriaceae bacterium]